MGGRWGLGSHCPPSALQRRQCLFLMLLSGFSPHLCPWVLLWMGDRRGGGGGMVAGEVGNHSRHSAYSTFQLAPTTSLATITPWEGTQCGFPCPFFRVGDRSPQRAHVLCISDAQCERGQNGDQDGSVKEVTGQARSPGVERSHQREGRKCELGPDSYPQPGHQGPQGSPSGLRASLSPYLEMPSFSLNRPPLSPPGLCGSPSGAPPSPSAGQHAHHSSVYSD